MPASDWHDSNPHAAAFQPVPFLSKALDRTRNWCGNTRHSGWCPFSDQKGHCQFRQGKRGARTPPSRRRQVAPLFCFSRFPSFIAAVSDDSNLPDSLALLSALQRTHNIRCALKEAGIITTDLKIHSPICLKGKIYGYALPK